MPSTMSPIDSRHPLLRTWLFGPGADSAMHDAMSECGATVLILDLEDSTPPPPYTFTDAKGAAQEARYARRLGYRAKSVVRVDHAAAILAALIPSDVQQDQARRMVEAFEAARARGEDRALVDGLWVEVPTYLNAKRLLVQP